MKIILVILSLIVAYFLIKRNKKTKEKSVNVGSMVMCNECGFHVPEDNLCTTKDQINQCRNRK